MQDFLPEIPGCLMLRAPAICLILIFSIVYRALLAPKGLPAYPCDEYNPSNNTAGASLP
jgi:hypothetical protein